MADFDPELITALKLAKSKKMFFAFVPKGAEGKLLVSKKKIPPKDIAAAKKEIGGGTPVTGKCFGPINNLSFLTVKPAPTTMKAALKTVCKRDAGLIVVADIQLAADADSEEEGETTGAAPADAAAPAPAASVDPLAPAEKPDAPGKTDLAGIQTVLKKLGYDPGEIDGVMGPKTEAAIKKFQQANGLAVDGKVGPKTKAALATALKGGAAPAEDAKGAAGAAPADKEPAGKAAPAEHDLGPWTAARAEAIKDLKALATKVAGTKHGSAAGVLKEINSIVARLPADPKPHEIGKLMEFVRTDETITAAEEVPGHFHNLDIRAPLLKALEGLRK